MTHSHTGNDTILPLLQQLWADYTAETDPAQRLQLQEELVTRMVTDTIRHSYHVADGSISISSAEQLAKELFQTDRPLFDQYYHYLRQRAAPDIISGLDSTALANGGTPARNIAASGLMPDGTVKPPLHGPDLPAK